LIWRRKSADVARSSYKEKSLGKEEKEKKKKKERGESSCIIM